MPRPSPKCRGSSAIGPSPLPKGWCQGALPTESGGQPPHLKMPEGSAVTSGGRGRLNRRNSDDPVEPVVANSRPGSPRPVARLFRRSKHADGVPSLVGLLEAAGSWVAFRSGVQHRVPVVNVEISSGWSDDNRERAVLDSHDTGLECAVGAMKIGNGLICKPLPDLQLEKPMSVSGPRRLVMVFSLHSP